MVFEKFPIERIKTITSSLFYLPFISIWKRFYRNFARILTGQVPKDTINTKRMNKKKTIV